MKMLSPFKDAEIANQMWEMTAKIGNGKALKHNKEGK